MSVRVMSEVWRLDLPPNEKFVLLALADHADDDGGKVFPSIALIAWKTGFTERGVQKVMRRLASEKLIVAVKKRPGATTVYRIETGAGKLKAPLNPVHPPTPRTIDANPEPGSPLPLNPVHPTPEPGSPDPSVNHQCNRQGLVTGDSRRLPRRSKPSSVAEVEKLGARLGYGRELILRFIRYNNTTKWTLKNWRGALRRFKQCCDGPGAVSEIPPGWTPVIE